MGAPWVYFDGKDCSGCKHLNDRGDCEFTACIIPCTVRATIPDVKPKTNADRIRSMEDEELAHMFSEIADCADCIFDATPDCTTNDLSCQKRWLKWLREEVEE